MPDLSKKDFCTMDSDLCLFFVFFLKRSLSSLQKIVHSLGGFWGIQIVLENWGINVVQMNRKNCPGGNKHIATTRATFNVMVKLLIDTCTHHFLQQPYDQIESNSSLLYFCWSRRKFTAHMNKPCFLNLGSCKTISKPVTTSSKKRKTRRV